MYDKTPIQRNSFRQPEGDRQPNIADYDSITKETKAQIENFYENTEFAVEDQGSDVNFWIYGTKNTLEYFIDQIKELNPDKKILVIKDYQNNERWLTDCLTEQLGSR